MKDFYLTGQLFFFFPSIADPRFARAVILVCSHTKEGAMGLVLSHPVTDLTLGKILKEMNISSNERAPLDLPILSGGPMDTGRGFLLHTLDFEEPDTLKVLDRFGVTGTLEALRDVAIGKGPQDLLFILGYSGWGAGQLEQELQENAWLVTSADHDLIFSTPTGDKWDRAFARLGVDPLLLSAQSGRA